MYKLPQPTPANVLLRCDWQMLHWQKAQLIRLMDEHKNFDGDERLRGAIEGILSLLDVLDNAWHSVRKSKEYRQLIHDARRLSKYGGFTVPDAITEQLVKLVEGACD